MSGIVLDLAQQDYTYARATRRPGQDVFLDKRQSAEIVMGDHSLASLVVDFDTGTGAGSYQIGIHTEDGGVTLNGPLAFGTKVFVNGTEIATISELVPGGGIAFQFADGATADLVEKLIGAITFKDMGSDGFKPSDRFLIRLIDSTGTAATSEITVGEAVTGTDGSDTFTVTNQTLGLADELDGGAGDDRLDLIDGGFFYINHMDKFTGIETIQGSDTDDNISIDASQWSGLKRIDAGGGHNELQLHGLESDLSDTEILNFEAITLKSSGGRARVANVDIGKLFIGHHGPGNELIIESGILTAAERLALHRRGIEKITTLQDGQTTSYDAPQFAHFGGTVWAGAGDTVFLDRKRDAGLSVDAGRLSSLTVEIAGTEGEDTLGIAASGSLLLTNGLKSNSELLMVRTADDGTLHAVNFGRVTLSASSGNNIYAFRLEFNANAKIEWVQQIIRLLIYKNSVGLEGDRRVAMTLADVDGRETSTEVMVSSDPIHQNKIPSDVSLSGTAILENAGAGTVIGTLSARDGDGDALTYTLIDDAGGRFEIRNGKLAVKDGTKLDFEAAASHRITVTVSDGETSVAKDFVIHVDNVLELVTGASRGKDILKGDIGADRLNGGSGNDKLTGGAGADQFVFDSALGKGTTKANQNRNVNFDTITDFKRGEDKILLDNAIFKKLGKGSLASPGALKKTFFKKNKATDKDDYLIYKNGVISYDADGSGTKVKPVEFIKLTNKASLSATDFLII